MKHRAKTISNSLAPSCFDSFVLLCNPYLRYCCNVGTFHMKAAMDPSVGVTEDANLQRWVLGRARVLVRAAATAVGAEPLQALVAHFKRLKQWLEAAKIEWAIAALGEQQIGGAHGSTAALALIEEHALRSEEAHQLVSLYILFARCIL